MIKTNAVLFLVFMTATTIVSATPSIQVRGSLSLEDTSTKLSLHVRDETSYQYRLDDGALSDCERPVRPEVLCEVPVTPGIHDLQLVITAPGYKTFFRTLARLQIGNENIAVDLENLKLIPSELKVVQVLKKVSSGGGAEFEMSSNHRTLIRSPRLPRKMYTWPENGFSCSAVCTIPLSPTKPRRISVTPATIQMRVPAGSPIIGANTPSPCAKSSGPLDR